MRKCQLLLKKSSRTCNAGELSMKGVLEREYWEEKLCPWQGEKIKTN
jgi:hypothetical protein